MFNHLRFLLKRHAPRRERSMTGRTTARIVVSAILLSISFVPPRASAEYPERPVKIVVPYAPGGATDLVARLVAQKIADELKQSFVVENRPGAGGMIGESTVARSVPDGYTVLIDATGVVLNPSLYRRPAYTPNDLLPVAQLMTSPFVIVVNPDVPIRAANDVADYAAKNANKFNVATAGNSTLLAGQLFRLITNADFTFVPYNGAAPASMSVVSGQTQMMFSDLTSFGQNIASGRLRALAVAGEKRLATLPEVPTTREIGMPQYVVSSWFGAFVPAGTPTDIVQRLNVAINRAVMQPDVVARLATLGAEPVTLTVGAFGLFYRNELARWKDVIDKAKIPLLE
jgi:tripartite-type tricarboxylate transporter receptor subunit TctC